MSLLEIVHEVRRYLEESGRLSYRMLRREFSLDDDTFAEVVEELVDNQRIAVREDNALAWSAAAAPSQVPAEMSSSPPEHDPRSYTPKHLADRILHSKAALEGERKQVTVLFADVSGFTAMSEKLDPEDVHAIMDAAFEVILNEVHRYAGTINQFLGDGVMALFGALITNEDHAQRALSAALAIQSGLQPLADEVQRTHGVEFRMRMGINTGLVVVGAIGRDLRMDYTAVGDTTNLAARLLGIAQPGQIVISRRTQQLSAGFFVCEDLGEFQVKGTTESVRAYAVSHEISGQTRLEVSREREQEIASPVGLHRQAADGQGMVRTLLASEGAVGEFVNRQHVAVREDDAPALTPRAYTPKHLVEKIMHSKAALEGERKQVTVLFADVPGFIAVSEKLDPEEVHVIMDAAFEVILNEVHRYEGMINQFLGDGVMALFGAPVANEDHAQRALSAALAIQSGLTPLTDEMRQRHGVEFRMRMGINTGLVVVGAIGRDLRMDYTAVGDTTNLAARLLGIAQPGQIVISRRTQRLSAGFFVCEDLGEFQVKGKREPVRAYAVSSEISDQTRLEVSRERGLTPLVGRAQELESLTGLHRRAADGQGAIALLVGDAGVGKSRLLYEFLHRIEAAGGLELKTNCASYGRSMAYRPIVALLRRYLGLSGGISGEEIRSRVAEQLQFLGLAGEERSILLAHFLGVSAPPEFLNRFSSAQLKEQLLGVLRDVFLGASELAPLILIVENMHWIDSASEEFLAHLAPGLPGHRVLLVLTTRLSDTASWLAAPLAQTLALEGLGVDDVRGMVRTLLAAEEVAEPLFKLLADKSEGNPLYVEEILRQLQETGGIAIENGEARLSHADVTVPATIHDIIAARVDHLAEPLKQTLQGAAVVGRRFGISLVSRILQVVPDQVAEHLRDLHALDFIFPSAQAPELMYIFKHALTQDVVYEGVLERRRRRYHAAAGFGLEELHAGQTDEVVELLAYHFGRSPENEKAVDFAILAAEKAQRRWANTEALASFEDALKRVETMPDTESNRLRRIDAVLKQGEVKYALGRNLEHVVSLEGIRTVVDETADPRRRATWYYWMGFLHSSTRNRPEVAIAYCREAVAIADTGGCDDIRAFADSCLAQVHLSAGNLWEAVATGERALAAFEASGDVWWACRTLWHLITVASALGEWSRAFEYCHRALEHGLAVDDLRLKVVGWYRTGSTHIQQGDPVPGLQCCETALALAPIPFDAAMIQANRGRALVQVGQVERGIAELTAALAWFEKSRLHYTRVWFATWLGDVYLQQGELSQARVLFEEILRTSREAGHRRIAGVAERGLGESLVAEDPDAAAEHLEAALQVLEAMGARNEVAKALVAQAQLHRALGDAMGARSLLARALALFETLGTLDEPRRVQAILATLEDSRKAISRKDSPSSIPSPLTGEGEGGGAREAQGTGDAPHLSPPHPNLGATASAQGRQALPPLGGRSTRGVCISKIA